MNPTMLALAVERAVRTRRFRYSNETDLQLGLAQAFTADGLPFEREVEIDIPEQVVKAPADGLALNDAKRAFVAGESKVLILSLRSGAGLDGLQHVCRTVVFGELDWSPGVHEQCVGRVARDGQSDPVAAYYLLADAGSDPIVSDVLGLKRQQADGIRDPNADLVETLQVDDDRIKKLAAAFLEQRGERVARRRRAFSTLRSTGPPSGQRQRPDHGTHPDHQARVLGRREGCWAAA
jgi:hypothetical protein